MVSMKKVRVQLEVILEIDVDDVKDDNEAMKIAESMAMGTLYNNYTSECVLDHPDDGIYMASAGAVATDCEDVDYENN